MDKCPREMVGAMVVQATLWSLAQQHPSGISKCPDWLVKIVFVTKLVDKATESLNELVEHHLSGNGENTERVLESYYKHGLLHALMLMLFNRVGLPSSSPKHFSSDGHQMIFLYLADKRFLGFFALLVDLLQRQAQLPLPKDERDRDENDVGGVESVPGIFKDDPANATLWVVPALLVLDTMSQPLLVARGQLSADTLEMQKYLSEHEPPLWPKEKCIMVLAHIKSEFNVVTVSRATGHAKPAVARAH